jgi:NAD(P)-dependent dehydrogenase (short-subunit alcohol dehydrogenase family)
MQNRPGNKLRLDGKVAIITGGASGIGRATALLFAREGAAVIVGGNKPEEHPSLLAAAQGLPGSLTAVEMDVTRESDVERLVSRAVEGHDGLDILVNNAGLVSSASAPEETEEQFQRLLDVNLKGVFFCSKHAVPAMRRRGGGAIVNIASINGIRGNLRLAAYCATKGGVVSLTHAMALDHAPENIRVNCVCPGTVERTGMFAGTLEEAEDPEETTRSLLAKHPLGRLAVPEDVAAAALFLASDDASYITGVALPVDGGRSIR